MAFYRWIVTVAGEKSSSGSRGSAGKRSVKSAEKADSRRRPGPAQQLSNGPRDQRRQTHSVSGQDGGEVTEHDSSYYSQRVAPVLTDMTSYVGADASRGMTLPSCTVRLSRL